MEQIFNWLLLSLYSSYALALLAALLWGVASIVLSPCHLSGIPLMIAFLTGDKELNTRRAFRFSLLFSLGILFSLLVIGIITVLLGRIAGDLGSKANVIFGIVLILGGILLLDLLPLPALTRLNKIKSDTDSRTKALSTGFIFGMALGPCSFSFMAPILGFVFASAAQQLGKGILMLLFYAIGHCGVIVLAGTGLGWAQRVINWNSRSSGLLILKRICAILVILGGIYLIVKY